MGRPETDVARKSAMNVLGNGLHEANCDEDALTVREAELSLLRRLGGSEEIMLALQGNLALTYQRLGRLEEALRIRQDGYSGYLKLAGDEHEKTLIAASNYAGSLLFLEQFEEAKSLLRKTLVAARCVLGESDELTLKMRWVYAEALYKADGATLDDLREAVTTLEDTARTARRVLGSSHPLTEAIEQELEHAREALRAREETPPAEDLAEEVD